MRHVAGSVRDLLGELDFSHEINRAALHLLILEIQAAEDELAKTHP